jgi:hypothetical protein
MKAYSLYGSQIIHFYLSALRGYINRNFAVVVVAWLQGGRSGVR